MKPRPIDVWKPIPNTSQEVALNSRCHITLYTGARGPGKTDTQLMRFRSRVGVGYGPFWKGVIFDREYKQLDDLVSKSKRWFHAFMDGAKFLESKADYRWEWPSGEQLLFRSIEKPGDYWNYHGQEYPFIGWNELAKYPTLELFDLMMSCNRSSFTPEKDGPRNSRGELIPIRPIPLEVFATTNPYGPGHNAVKTRFIDPAPFGRVIRTQIEVFDPAKKENVIVERTQVTIHGSWRENIYLAPEYVAQLVSISDPNLKAAWDSGSWDITSGGALDGVWDKSVHIIPRFQVPDSWRIDRALDWGSSHPYSVGWFAETNGEEALLPDGSVFGPPPGSIIQLGEIYGATALGTNKGVQHSPVTVADKIIAYEAELIEENWIASRPYPGPADNQIRDVREIDIDTIEKRMADRGIRWLESDKSPGSRRNGLQMVRDRLEAAKKRTQDPHLYFMDNCRASIATIPNLPRDEDKLDDVDTTSEDHPYDMVRYRVLRGSNREATNLKIVLPH